MTLSDRLRSQQAPEQRPLRGDDRLWREARRKLVGELFPLVEENSLSAGPEANRILWEKFQPAFQGLGMGLPDSAAQILFQEVVEEILGYGPIEPFLKDPSISEVMVNGPGLIYVERSGHIEETGAKFEDEEHVLRIINRILDPLGRRVDRKHPMVDARLPDGSRVNVIIPPSSMAGPVITVRKFPQRFTVEDLVKLGTLTPDMVEFLKACVVAKLNTVVSGGTGSGKTTLLNVLSSFIPEVERIVTIEDSAELQLRQKHVLGLEARPPDPDGTGGVVIRDLVRNSLRMRPDRIVVGEVRGGEALDMLQAMNTGHEGSLTTVHANSPRDAVSRLETMVLMAGFDLPVRVIREQIAAAIDVIVQQARLRDGSRKVVSVSEVVGMEGEVVVMQDIFLFQEEGMDEKEQVVGRYRATGIRPRFSERLEAKGFQLPAQVFGYTSTGLRSRNRP
ncbi:MAG: CpaF family protein [Chloroflexi bacterium]|nr:CpaF family protein [Chloroflexota bacterium]